MPQFAKMASVKINQATFYVLVSLDSLRKMESVLISMNVLTVSAITVIEMLIVRILPEISYANASRAMKAMVFNALT